MAKENKAFWLAMAMFSLLLAGLAALWEVNPLWIRLIDGSWVVVLFFCLQGGVFD